MAEHNDALWDPRIGGDAQLQRIEALLRPMGVSAQGMGDWSPLQGRSTHTRWWNRRAPAAGLAASILLAVMVGAGLQYRLTWDVDRPWSVVGEGSDPMVTASTLAPGEVLASAPDQSLSIDVARIGRIALSPESQLRLIETRSGKHRISLEHGHLRARIWAPPGYFGVSVGAAEVVDLGCEFDLWKQVDGSGRLIVRSGWVSYQLMAQQVLLPAGYELRFDEHHVSTPIRSGSGATFAASVLAMDRALEQSGPVSTRAQSAAVDLVNAALDADAFTLLSLLSRYPELAGSAIYPRLALALNVSADDQSHRNAWAARDLAAIEQWWQKYPSQPKQWWRHWADALPIAGAPVAHPPTATMR